MILIDKGKVAIVEQKRGKDKRKRKVKRIEIDEEVDEQFRWRHRD